MPNPKMNLSKLGRVEVAVSLHGDDAGTESFHTESHMGAYDGGSYLSLDQAVVIVE